MPHDFETCACPCCAVGRHMRDYRTPEVRAGHELAKGRQLLKLQADMAKLRGSKIC